MLLTPERAFLAIATIILFTAHASIQTTRPVIHPDESVYACWLPPDVTDWGAYLAVYCLAGGYYGVLTANALFATLTLIPLYFLAKRASSSSAQTGAILAVLLSFYPPLWAYATLNMTDSLYLLTVLTVFALKNPVYALFCATIKPLGVIPAITRNAPISATIAIAGLTLAALILTGEWVNAGLAALRGVMYAGLASLGSVPILFSSPENKEIKAFLASTLISYGFLGCLVTFTFMGGRYLDAPILLSLALLPNTAHNPPVKRLLPIALIFLLAAFLYFSILPFHYTMPYLDSGIRYDVFLKLGKH